MNALEFNFWSGCSLVERVPDEVSGVPVVVGTRVPADTLVENVEAYMELRGLSKEKAIAVSDNHGRC